MMQKERVEGPDVKWIFTGFNQETGSGSVCYISSPTKYLILFLCDHMPSKEAARKEIRDGSSVVVPSIHISAF